jgi:ATP-binding cassette subfamily B protein
MLYDEAEVLIVDEPTSARDPLAEFKIYETLRELAKDKIVIRVTQRLYNLKLADDLIVMQNDGILEKRSHAELKAKEGEDHCMFEKQH